MEDFDAFARANLHILSRYAAELTGDRRTAQDLVQDTLASMARSWRTVCDDGRPLAYARTTMARLHGSRLRRMLRRRPGASASSVSRSGAARSDTLQSGTPRSDTPRSVTSRSDPALSGASASDGSRPGAALPDARPWDGVPPDDPPLLDPPEDVQWVVPSDAVMAAVARRMARRKAARTAIVCLTVALFAVAAVFTVGAARRGDPMFRIGVLDVKGLPGGWSRMDDVEASAVQPPAISSLPSHGRRSAYQRFDMQGVWRVIAIAGYDDPGAVTLPGLNVDPPADWTDRGRIVLSETGDTLFLLATRSDGGRWFIAVTGGTDADRLAFMRVLAENNLSGA